MNPIKHQPDPQFDLYLERTAEVTPELIWKAWTDPEMLKKWFCPLPWKTTYCEIDLRPGGIFKTTMNGPNGEEHTGAGCFLEIVENRKLVWTSALGPGYRPQSEEPFLFTAVITMEPHGTGSKYSALAIHSNKEACETHAKMGFHEGWGTAFDQLVALVQEEK